MRLTAEERELIDTNEKVIDNVMKVINAVKQFKEGDYLIAFHQATNWDDKRKRPVVNSYGAPKKFQVVAVDKHGIPYIKELNKKGKPTGQLISSVKHNGSRGIGYDLNMTYYFEVDPDYTDAIILDSQADFNAAALLKEKADNFKAIAEHNKNIKVECNDLKLLAMFIAAVKVGDVLWRSNISSWTVTEINPIPKKHGGVDNHTNFMKVMTSKGKEISLSFWDLRGRALYISRPRTYRELRDPK